MSGWLGMGRKTKADRKREDSSPTRGFHAAYVNAHFRELADGRTAFRQGGLFNRRGYIVASTEQMLLLRESVVQYRRIGMRVYVGFVLVLSGFFSTAFLEIQFWQQLATLAGIGVVAWIAERCYFHPLTRRMEPINVPRISRLESWRSMGRTVSPTVLAFITLFSAGLVTTLLYLYVERSKPIFLVLGLMGGVSLVGYAIAWRSWWAARHE